VGEGEPRCAYLFDLAGAYPRCDNADTPSFYDEIVLRLVTALSTRELTNYAVKDPPISAQDWSGLSVEADMLWASRELGKRRFFTQKILVEDLVRVPRVTDTIAAQYSEGCFATFEPRLDALVCTVTGSSHPVDKGCIGRDDLAVVVGLLPGGDGVLVRQVEGLRNSPPSSEAVEFQDLDSVLPRIRLGGGWSADGPVPAIRSKLHGHRGVAAFDPLSVEFVPLDLPYYHLPVSCSTEAQVWAVKAAFSRSRALLDSSDPRQVVFTVLPGHGVVMVERWVQGKRPFEVLLEGMDLRRIEVVDGVAQGPMCYMPDAEGRMVLQGEWRSAGSKA